MDARTKTNVLTMIWSALFTFVASFLIASRIYFWGVLVGLIALFFTWGTLQGINNEKLDMGEEANEIEYTKGKRILLSSITILVVVATATTTLLLMNHFRPASFYENQGKNKKVETVYCDSCHNYYRVGSQNAKSIRNTGMCTSCYENFRYVYDALNEMPVN